MQVNKAAKKVYTVDELKALVAKNGGNQKYRLLLSRALLKKKDKHAAMLEGLAALDKALRLNKAKPLHYENLLKIALTLGMHKIAEIMGMHAVNIGVSSANLSAQMARSLIAQKDTETAMKWLDHAAKQDPTPAISAKISKLRQRVRTG